MSDLVFVPLDFCYSLLMLVYALGYSTLTGVLMYAVVYCVNWQKDKFNRASDESIRVIEEQKHSKLQEIFEYAKHIKLFGWQRSFEASFDNLRHEERSIQEQRAYRGLIASNVQSIVSQFLPTSIFMTFIYLGHKVDLATFITAGILIGKVRTPTDKLLSVSSRIKSLN